MFVDVYKGATTVKFEVRRYWVDCLGINKQLWKEKAAKGKHFLKFFFK